MRISMIFAMAQNKVIGAKSKLPWYLPEDLKKFRLLTTGHPIVMGRKTFESLPKVLPGREHYVITRNAAYKDTNAAARDSEHVFVTGTPSEALGMIRRHIGREREMSEEVFIIGGGEIFRQMLPLADRLYMTFIKEDIPGDTYFPEIDPGQWNETERQVFEGFDFIIYDRIGRL